MKYSLEYYAHDEANKKYSIGFVKDEDGKDTDVLSMFSLICEPSKHAFGQFVEDIIKIILDYFAYEIDPLKMLKTILVQKCGFVVVLIIQ